MVAVEKQTLYAMILAYLGNDRAPGGLLVLYKHTNEDRYHDKDQGNYDATVWNDDSIIRPGSGVDKQVQRHHSHGNNG